MGEPTEKASLHIQKEKFMMEIGAMIRHMASGYTPTITELAMKAIGIKICNMEKAQRAGQMDRNLPESTKKDERMELENISGQTVPAMKGNGRTMRSPGMVITSGPMAVNILVIGKVTSWTISASTLGKMVVCMRVSTLRTRSMAMECTLGVTRRNIQGGGTKVSSMVLAFSFQEKEPRESSESGKTERRSDGSAKKKPYPLRAVRLRICVKSSKITQIFQQRKLLDLASNSCLRLSFIRLARG